VSNDIGNIFSNVIEVVAMPTHCTISAKSGTKILDSIVLCEYPIPLPIENFLEKFGRCSECEIENIKECLKISLGL
jgi:mRNA-degrading endonuclease toxin of MazEF toxin-antitoxin module